MWFKVPPPDSPVEVMWSIREVDDEGEDEGLSWYLVPSSITREELATYLDYIGDGLTEVVEAFNEDEPGYVPRPPHMRERITRLAFNQNGELCMWEDQDA